MIRLISAEETYPLRLSVLRAGMAPESAIFPGDNDSGTKHFGAFSDQEIVGVASIYRAPFPEESHREGTWQLRGMAVAQEFRNRAIGVALVRTCLDYVHGEAGTLIWCNARTPAVRFYEQQGFVRVSEEFEIPTAGPHFRMSRVMPLCDL